MKKKIKEQVPRQGKKPFFARLLESQELERASGGKCPPYQTKKYPSDSDEFVTLKYPSDNDDDVTK